MLEKEIEQKLVEAVKARHGKCPKWVCPGWAGVPDRLILLPGGRFAFAALKQTGRKPRPLQMIAHEELRRLGFSVYVVDSVGMINEVLNEIQSA